MANSVYDPETGEEPTYKSPPDLGPGHTRAAGDPPSDPRGDLRKAERGRTGTSSNSSLNRGSGDKTSSNGSGFNFNPTGDKGAPLGPHNIKGAETATGSGTFFKPDERGRRFNRSLRYLKQNRKKTMIGGGAIAGLITVIVAGFMLLIPLKIEHVVTNLQHRFGASSEEAVNEQTQNLLQRYLSNKVLPAYKDCGSTISKKCTPTNFGNNPVGNLYRSWANAKIENDLAEKYGIELKYDKHSNTWYLKAPGTDAKGDNIGPNGENLDREFHRADRSTVRQAFRNAMEQETRWKQIMYRYKVGRLLENKYGIVRCIMYCGKRDALADKADSKKVAAQLYIVQRVVSPRTGSMGIVLECMTNPNCHPEDTSPTAIGDQDGSYVEGENSETDTKQRHTLTDLARNYPGTSADELLREYNAISEKGYQKVLFEKAFEKLGFGRLSSQAADAVPIIGAIKAAADVITFANNAGPAIKKLNYITNSAAAASIFMMYRTYADEIHTGHVNATEVGSLVDSLGPGNQGPASDPIKGGTASAEATPLYQNMFGGSSGTRTASLSDSLLPSAVAASNSASDSNEYLCDDAKPVPTGSLVCVEEVFGQVPGTVANAGLDSAHAFLNLPVVGQITSLAGGVSGFAGTIGDFFGSVINAIPGLGSIVSNISGLISQVFEPFVNAVISVLTKNPFSSNMSGGRIFDMMAGGADTAYNLFAHIGLGGQVLSSQQAATIINRHNSNAEQDFASRSFFARTFDTNSEYSLVSKVAMSIPFGTQAAAQSGVANVLNPLSTISRGFGSMLSDRANAALTAQPDPFGITQYGYPEGAIPKDPETYWENHCSDDSSKAYQNEAEFNNAPGGQGWVGTSTTSAPDEGTGMPVNKTTNPCLLIKAAIGSAGGWFNTNLLTSFDRAGQSVNGTNGGASVVTPVSGEPQELAKALVDSGRLTDEDGRYMAQIQAVANGNYSCNVNPYILEMLYGVVVQDNHSVVMSSLNRFCTGVLTASGSASYHYTDGGGHAIDVTGFDGGDVNGGPEAATLGYLNSAVKYLPNNTGFGQVESCSSGFNIPPGGHPIPDACTHQHIQVPLKNLPR
jgi:hypothetical protein